PASAATRVEDADADARADALDPIAERSDADGLAVREERLPIGVARIVEDEERVAGRGLNVLRGRDEGRVEIRGAWVEQHVDVGRGEAADAHEGIGELLGVVVREPQRRAPDGGAVRADEHRDASHRRGVLRSRERGDDERRDERGECEVRQPRGAGRASQAPRHRGSPAALESSKRTAQTSAVREPAAAAERRASSSRTFLLTTTTNRSICPSLSTSSENGSVADGPTGQSASLRRAQTAPFPAGDATATWARSSHATRKASASPARIGALLFHTKVSASRWTRSSTDGIPLTPT